MKRDVLKFPHKAGSRLFDLIDSDAPSIGGDIQLTWAILFKFIFIVCTLINCNLVYFLATDEEVKAGAVISCVKLHVTYTKIQILVERVVKTWLWETREI